MHQFLQPILSSTPVNQSDSNTNYFLMNDVALLSSSLAMNGSGVLCMEVCIPAELHQGSMMDSAEL